MTLQKKDKSAERPPYVPEKKLNNQFITLSERVLKQVETKAAPIAATVDSTLRERPTMTHRWQKASNLSSHPSSKTLTPQHRKESVANSDLASEISFPVNHIRLFNQRAPTI